MSWIGFRWLGVMSSLGLVRIRKYTFWLLRRFGNTAQGKEVPRTVMILSGMQQADYRFFILVDWPSNVTVVKCSPKVEFALCVRVCVYIYIYNGSKWNGYIFGTPCDFEIYF
jgi:hypothetical protein